MAIADARAPIWLSLLRVYREKGPAGVWFGALSRAGYRRLVLLARPLAEPPVPLPPRVEAEIRPLTGDDEAAFAALGQGDAAVFRRRLARGDAAWGAWCGGGLRYVSWVAFRETGVEYLRCRLVLADGVAYVYRAFAEPAYRRLGLGPAVQSACLEGLCRHGFRLALAAVVPENPWAFPPWLKVGYRRIGIVRAIGSRRPLIAVSVDRPLATPGGWSFVRTPSGTPREADAPG